MRARRALNPVRLASLAIVALPLCTAHAELTFVTESDVASRSFSVVAVSDQPVVGVTLDVFSDPDGLSPVSSAAVIVDSASVIEAHPNGIVKATARGLNEETAYYFRLTVAATGGDTSFPAAPPYFGVTTANRPVPPSSLGNVSLNELLSFQPYVPASATSPQSILVVLGLPGVSATPVSEFVSATAPVASTYFDANNLQDLNGARLPLGANVDVLLTEVRGLACSDARKTRFRRTPVLTAVGDALAYQPLTACFFADTVCDDTVDVLDFQFLLNGFGATSGECAYNPDLDIVNDASIDVLDMQGVLNRFGESAPFN